MIKVLFVLFDWGPCLRSVWALLPYLQCPKQSFYRKKILLYLSLKLKEQYEMAKIKKMPIIFSPTLITVGPTLGACQRLNPRPHIQVMCSTTWTRFPVLKDQVLEWFKIQKGFLVWKEFKIGKYSRYGRSWDFGDKIAGIFSGRCWLPLSSGLGISWVFSTYCTNRYQTEVRAIFPMKECLRHFIHRAREIAQQLRCLLACSQPIRSGAPNTVPWTLPAVAPEPHQMCP